MNTPGVSLLDTIHDPAALRTLPVSALEAVAAEVRAELIRTVSSSGGHLAAGLGTVELSVALHYVFDTPRDALVWDVGHQCYPHKVLTGRRDELHTIRKRGGLSGFLRRDESPYDAVGAGHSSTSISSALGIAVANERQGHDRRAVAIIGDGALTAGLAYEALQHAGSMDVDLLVILNDNGMSISPNVGSLSEYLGRLTTGQAASQASDDAEPDDGATRASAVTAPGQWFEDLGLSYVGPCDGHDVNALVATLQRLRDQRGPRLLHVVTRKGCGYAPAEADPIKYHGVTPFDPERGIVPGARPAPTYTDAFGQWLCEAAERDPRLVAITPAMREGSGLVRFAERFPERCFDVGIAEQHSVSFAAGLAAQGLHPVVAIYSTFLQRAYDQVVHDVALQGLPVLFAIDRAGVVGPDGATHNGAYDLSFMRCVPGMVVMTPASSVELRDMLHTGLHCGRPAAVRYPRAPVGDAGPARAPEAIPLGTAEVKRRGRGVAFLVFGTLLETVLGVAERLDATVVNMRFVKPLDERLVREMALRHELVVTVEENALAGGAGSAVNECLHHGGLSVSILNLGLPDRHLEHGTRGECLADAGLDAATIHEAVAARLPGLLSDFDEVSVRSVRRAGARRGGRAAAFVGEVLAR
jgi:1-deoxy-D-xylulose-5-phosphate synthase